MKKFILQYGVFIILSIMLLGIAWISGKYNIITKQPTILFISGGKCKAYIGHATNTFKIGDTLIIRQTPYGDLPFIIDSMYVEPTSVVYSIQSLNSQALAKTLNGNSYVQGFIITGYETIGKLILKKLNLEK